MMEMSLPCVTIELTHKQIKLLLLAVDTLDNLITDSETQAGLEVALLKHFKYIEDTFEMHTDELPNQKIRTWFSSTFIRAANYALLEKYHGMTNADTLN